MVSTAPETSANGMLTLKVLLPNSSGNIRIRRRANKPQIRPRRSMKPSTNT
jgi:hypothetical protein